METQPELSWPRLASFVRQHTHDVRNHLNGLDLEAALLSELVAGDEESKTSVDRLRRQIRELAAEMRKLSSKFAEPALSPVELPARDWLEIWKDQAGSVKPELEITWHDDGKNTRLKLDLDCVAKVFHELLSNAAAFKAGGPIRARVEAVDGQLLFTLTEPKSEAVDPSTWGRTLFSSTRRGGYGLGLWEVERMVAANGGEVRRSYDPQAKELVTTLAFSQ